MSYRVTRSSAKKENSQNNSPHGQTSSGSGNGQAASGGSGNLTPRRSPRFQGRGSQEGRNGINVSQRPFEPRLADSTSSSVTRTPLTGSSDLLRRMAMTRASCETGSVSPTPSPVNSIPLSPVITSMTSSTCEMQHDGKDENNFYEDDDSDRTIDYPSTPSENSSDSSSVWSNQSDRSSRSGTPAYDQNGCRSGGFFTSPRR